MSDLALEDASFAFGDRAIIDGVDLGLERGSLVGLVGPNGVGKTTVLELLGGLRTLDGGTVSRPETPGRTVAYLPQDPDFCRGFTVRQTVAFYADLVAGDVDPAAALERVGLDGVADRRVEALSGGMVRLLGLAQAFVGDPPVVLLDEPTGGLDPDVADRIFEAAAEVAAEDRVVVLASHDLGGVEAAADRVVLLTRDGVAFDDAPAAVLKATSTDSLRAAFRATVGDGLSREGAR